MAVVDHSTALARRRMLAVVPAVALAPSAELLGRPASAAAPPDPVVAATGQDHALVGALRRSLDADRDWAAAMLRESAAKDAVWNERQRGAGVTTVARAEAEAARQAELKAEHAARWAEAMDFLAARPAAGAIGLAAKVLALREAEDDVQSALRSEEATLLASVLQDADRLLAGVLPAVPPLAFAGRAIDPDAALLALADVVIRSEVAWRATFCGLGDQDCEAEAESDRRRQPQTFARDVALEQLGEMEARTLGGCIAKARVVAVCATHGTGGRVEGYGIAADLVFGLIEDLLQLGGTDVEGTIREALRHAEGVSDAAEIFLLSPAAGAGGVE